jgi:hypothetical protein
MAAGSRQREAASHSLLTLTQGSSSPSKNGDATDDLHSRFTLVKQTICVLRSDPKVEASAKAEPLRF